MAAKKKPYLVIQSKKALARLLNYIRDDDDGYRINDAMDDLKGLSIKGAAAFINDNSPRAQLEEWDEEHRTDLCETGFEKILAAHKAGVTSWKEYCRRNWNSRGDGFHGWLFSNTEELIGRWINRYNDGNYGTFKEFLDAHPDIKWTKWPFATQKRRVTKTKSSSRRKS